MTDLNEPRVTVWVHQANVDVARQGHDDDARRGSGSLGLTLSEEFGLIFGETP